MSGRPVVYDPSVAMPKRLRVVDPGETAAKPRRLTVTQAAAEGSHRELLVALRARVAAAAAVQSPQCPPVALAALSRQLTSISKELSVLDARVEDEIGEAAAVSDEVWDGAV
jgi:hypothetical protein